MSAGPQVTPARAETLRAELHWLDLTIQGEMLRLRAAYQLSLDEFRGLYISDEQVDALLREGSEGTIDLAHLDAAAAQARVDRRADPDAPLAVLARELRLSDLEQDILLMVAAPEIALKYETLYAYLNNEVSRRAATLDLASRLFGRDDAARLAVRQALAVAAPLRQSGLVRSPEPHGGLTAALKPHRVLGSFLLGLGAVDGAAPLRAGPRWRRDGGMGELDDATISRLTTTAQAWTHGSVPAPIWLLQGRDRALCEAAARIVAVAQGLELITLDLRDLPAAPDEFAEAIREVLLQQMLSDGGLHLEGVELLVDGDGRLTPEARIGLRQLRHARRPLFLAGDTPPAVAEALRDAHLITIEVPELDRAARDAAWTAALQSRGLSASAAAVANVAERFALACDQIQGAAQALADHRTGASTEMADAALAAAARAASDASIGRIAQRMAQRYGWEDLVLPASTLRRLGDIVGAIRDRQLVFGEWGFSRRAGGFGLRILFSGPSGTGKSMAAATIARELGVDIYRIDISQTVSKYIGETEKNLEWIFQSAAHSNALLFFDEADALFGKRSDVKDAHDRYSNVETAYLLQRIEDYQGVVILASNLSRNMDVAFSRRLNFVLEFPLPERADRERLWRLMLADGPQIADDLDLEFLAAQFPLSGGEIRNVVLDAAFIAAAAPERRIGMRALIVAVGRELGKQGRAPSAAEFKHHHALLAEG